MASRDLAVMSGKYYAVKHGRQMGIYRTWDKCKEQVHGFSGARFKSFKTLTEAQDFMGAPSRSGYRSNRGNGVATGYHGNYRGRRNHSGLTLPYCKTGTTDSIVPVVYCDGCCYANGQLGANGGVGVYWRDGSSWNVSEKLTGHQTNQRAELVSACRAIETALAQNYTTIELRSDSTYTIKAMTQWIDKWERDGWKTSTGDDVKNKEDMMRLRGLTKRINVKWVHVPGHVGIHGNEMADSLAKAGSEK